MCLLFGWTSIVSYFSALQSLRLRVAEMSSLSASGSWQRLDGFKNAPVRSVDVPFKQAVGLVGAHREGNCPAVDVLQQCGDMCGAAIMCERGS